jgi:hypothetical protein
VTSPEFQVDLGQLRDHANTVGDLAGQLSDAANGQPTGPATGALGVFVEFLTAGLTDAAAKTTGAVRAAASALDGARDGLNRAADQYQGTDEHNATNLTEAGPR